MLDEPWSGLDASAHEVLAGLLAEVAASGGTVLFTDHRESVARTHATRSLHVADGRVTPYGESRPRDLVDVLLAWRGSGPRPRRRFRAYAPSPARTGNSPCGSPGKTPTPCSSPPCARAGRSPG